MSFCRPTDRLPLRRRQDAPTGSDRPHRETDRDQSGIESDGFCQRSDPFFAGLREGFLQRRPCPKSFLKIKEGRRRHPKLKDGKSINFFLHDKIVLCYKEIGFGLTHPSLPARGTRPTRAGAPSGTRLAPDAPAVLLHPPRRGSGATEGKGKLPGARRFRLLGPTPPQRPTRPWPRTLPRPGSVPEVPSLRS